jgi:hypothetical protein
MTFDDMSATETCPMPDEVAGLLATFRLMFNGWPAHLLPSCFTHWPRSWDSVAVWRERQSILLRQIKGGPYPYPRD